MVGSPGRNASPCGWSRPEATTVVPSATPLLSLSGSATTESLPGVLTSIVPLESNTITRGPPSPLANVDIAKPGGMVSGRPVEFRAAGGAPGGAPPKPPGAPGGGA